jgi:hypothetical protein
MNPVRSCAVVVLTGLLFPVLAIAQKATEDVLYLKNGWILRGKITSVPADSLVKIQTRDQNLFVFSRPEISKMQQEPFQYKGNQSIFYQRRGFGHYTELGSIIAKNSTAGSAFTFQMVNGYQFSPWVFTGLGIGLDSYRTQSLLPLFGSYRGDLVHQGGLIPFYFVDGGYAFNLSGEGNSSGLATRYRGGTLFAAGAGTKILLSHHAGLLMSVGYRSQRTSFEQELSGVGGNFKTEMNYRRVVLRIGFTF